MSARDQRPDSVSLSQELKLLQRCGAGATAIAAVLEDLPCLVSLPVVKAAAGEYNDNYGYGVAIRRVLLLATERFDGDRFVHGYQALMGLTSSTEHLRGPSRRRLFMDAIDFDGSPNVESFLKREQSRFLASLADRILELETEVESRISHGSMASGRPVESSIAVDWLRRFEHYSRLGTYLGSAAADLITYFTLRNDTEAQERSESCLLNGLYHFSCLNASHELFKFECGGLWLLSSRQSELLADEYVYESQWHPRLGHFYMDWAAGLTGIRQGISPNLADFRKQFFASADDSRGALSRWSEWASSCQCGPDSIDKQNCSPHNFIGSSEAYALLIEDEWRLIAGWYADETSFDEISVPIEDLIKRFGIPRDTVAPAIVRHEK